MSDTLAEIARILWNGGDEAALGEAAQALADTLARAGAVSYTHLDVYKRQKWWRVSKSYANAYNKNRLGGRFICRLLIMLI